LQSCVCRIAVEASRDLSLYLYSATNEIVRKMRQFHLITNGAQAGPELIGEFQRRKDAAYILKKAGVETRQSASGALVPEYPVHGREVGEKLLAHISKNQQNDSTR